MRLSPDEIIFWEFGFIKINLTIAMTWAIMLLLALGAWLITRNVTTRLTRSRWQNVLEMIVLIIRDQIEEIGLKKPEKYLGFIGTLFLFIAVSSLFTIVPGYEAPTASLSTTTALALSVFISVPAFGIAHSGLKNYLSSLAQPNVLMLPLNIMGEISRTISLAFRLFGNMMSGGLIASILIAIAPFFFPIIMDALGLLTGMLQAYIFAVLATVYIAAGMQNEERKELPPSPDKDHIDRSEIKTRQSRSNLKTN